MEIQDTQLIARIIKLCNTEKPKGKGSKDTLLIKKAKDNSVDLERLIYPLDKEILEDLKKLLDFIQYPSNDIYQKADLVNDLWGKLIEKSIICLRYFDTREPFISSKSSNKKPTAYGIEELVRYYKAFDEFEGLLYGSNKFYRDHLIHVFRTWLIGVYLMIDSDVCRPNGKQENRMLIDYIRVEGTGAMKNVVDKKEIDKEDVSKEGSKATQTIEAGSEKINFFEKISMWTIIALCHDLGYPLEKSQQILNKTREMMNYFISNPRIWSDISFSGIQDNINEYVVKFMSSKMIDAEEKDEDGQDLYYGRIQPKYYIKYTKSLERYKHGIISALIIYKMLLYFIESDFNMNEDYKFKSEDKRQFYIRREILRAIAGHTCEDIYHMKLTTFSALLINCDELQEWDRRKWDDFYTGLDKDAISITVKSFSSEGINIEQVVNVEKNSELRNNILKGMLKQFDYYKTIFRDGQDTSNRNFDFKKSFTLNCKTKHGDEEEIFGIELSIKKDEAAMFKIDTSGIVNEDARETIETEIKELFKKHKTENILIN